MRATPRQSQHETTVQHGERRDRHADANGRDGPRKAVAGVVELLSRTFVTAAAVTFFVAGVVLLAILVLT